MNDPITTRLMRLDACALSDACDKLGISACVTGLLPLSAAKKIAGRIHTVKLVRKEDGPRLSGKPRHLGTAAIEACAPGEVIVVEQKSGLDAGSWGGLLSIGAKVRGVAGIVADGPVRDIDEARQLGFPIYAPRPTARTARNRVVEAATDVPIEIGNIVVDPGDYVLADSSAVIFVRADQAEIVIDAAEKIARCEAAMAKAIKEGKVISDVLAANYEDMLS